MVPDGSSRVSESRPAGQFFLSVLIIRTLAAGCPTRTAKNTATCALTPVGDVRAGIIGNRTGRSTSIKATRQAAKSLRLQR
jgi:hypothetical protein